MMADYPSPRQLPASSPSTEYSTRSDRTGHGHFDTKTYPQVTQMKKVARYIRRDLLPTDQLTGYVYVAKQADTGFCKVGFAEKDAERRIKDIGKCQIVTDSSYRIGGFVGAYRAERLVHCLLSHCRHIRQECPCGCENREWYKSPYEEVKRQVQIVYAWLRREPYETTKFEKKLKPVWKEALNKWLATQKTQAPLGWNEFFITGPSMDVVIGGLCYDSSPQPLSSRQLSTRRHANRFVINIMGRSGIETMLRTGMKQAKLHLTHHGRGGASVSPASKVRPPHWDEQSSPKISGDWETADEELDPTPSKPPQSRLLRTWDQWSTARDIQTGDIAVSGLAAHSQTTAIVDLANESSSSSFPNPPYSTWRAPSADECQQTLSLPTIQQDNNDTSVHANNRTGDATYHLQATIGLSDIGTPSGGEESPGRRKKVCSTGDQDIIGNTEMRACMPGAFPEDEIEIEKASPTELDRKEVPELLDLLKEFAITQNVNEEEPLSQVDSNATGALPVDNNIVISISDDILPVSDQLVSEVASLVSEQLPSVPIPVSTSTSDSALSTYDRSQPSTLESSSVYGSVPGHTAVSTPDDNCQSQHKADVSSFEAHWYRDGDTKLLPIGLTGDAATQGNVTEAYRPSVAAESARSETDHDSSVIADFKMTVTASSYPSGGLGPCGTPGVHSVPPSEGTTVTTFVPTTKDTPISSQRNAYQSICFMQPYQTYSFEEPRLVDYNAGHRFAVEDDVEYDENASDWETQSSLSDDDRPWAKQRGLARELWDLCDENSEYTYGLNMEKLKYESGWDRLERLRRDLEAMDVQSTQHTRLPTWQDWLDEPSEDDPEDESWCATGAEKEANDNDVKQDESSAEDEVSVKREYSPPKSPHKPSPASALHLNVAAPALTPFAAQFMSTEVPRVSSFKFSSATFNVKAPEFNPTRPLGSSPITSSANKALASTTKVFGDVVIDPTLKATRRKSKAVPTVRPVLKEGLGSILDSNHGEGMLTSEDDDEGRPQARTERQKCQKHAHSATATAGQLTRKMNQPEGRSHSQQSSPRVNNMIARSADGRPALAIENEEHQSDVEEESKNSASESSGSNRHIPSPSCAWGADGNLGLDRMAREPFRERDFLSQSWSFNVS